MTPDLNREVGEIKAQVRFVTAELHEIKSDVKKLLAFKWQLTGFAMFGAFMATVVVDLIRR